ncbi:MAG: apolipoprotein N-acyltransferase [Rhodospirillales bacterium]
MTGYPDLIAGLTGWRRLVAALVAGALASLALPPAYILPVLLISFPVLLLLLGRCRKPVQALLTGFAFGFGFYAVGLYWIGFALLVEAARFAWLLPVAVFGIAGILALFSAIACLPAWAVRKLGGGWISAVLALAGGWTLLEWCRNWAFTGFPWNPVGSVWGVADIMVQPASVIGVFGLSLLTVMLAGVPLLLVTTSGVTRRVILGLAVLAVTGWAGGGYYRLDHNPTVYAENVGLRLVQANIDQRDKWRRDLRVPNLTRLLALSADQRPDWVTHVIWPETAATFFLTENPDVVRAIASVAPAGGAVLTGAPRQADSNGTAVYYNSLQAISGKGEILATYDKAHLVPFGEYVPLRNWLPVERIVAGRGDFTAGPGLRTIRLPNLPAFSPLICYEAIFPGGAVDPADRPDWILNISNDAWFGVSAGPHQHLAAARMRAAEEGLPLIRATNTGITVAFDAYGRELQRLDLDRRGTLDLRLPKPASSPTIFSLFGNVVPVLLAGFIVLVAIWPVLQSRRRSAGGN